MELTSEIKSYTLLQKIVNGGGWAGQGWARKWRKQGGEGEAGRSLAGTRPTTGLGRAQSQWSSGKNRTWDSSSQAVGHQKWAGAHLLCENIMILLQHVVMVGDSDAGLEV